MILCSVELLPESSNLADHRLSDYKKMADIVVGAQQIQIEIRLQMRLKMFAQIRCHFIFICIYCIQLRILFQYPCNLIQGIWCKQVIMIQNSCKLSFCHLKCGIRIPRNSQILSEFLYTYTTVFLRVFIQHPFHRFIVRTSVGNTQFPVRISLCQKRIYHLSEKKLRCMVCRNCNAQQRFTGKSVSTLSLKLFFIRHIGFIPRTIWYFFRLKAFVKSDPEFLRSIMLKITQSFLYCIWIEFFQHSSPLNMPCHIFIFTHTLFTPSGSVHFFSL